MSSFVLRYFPVQSRAETIKAILSYANANWTNEVPAWPQEKNSQPVGKLPVLIETLADGTQFTVCESRAIEYYLARQFGLSVNETPEEEARQMELCSQIKDIFELSTFYKYAPPGEFRDVLMETFLSSTKAIIEYHEKILKENGANGHYFGNKVTYIDLAAFASYYALKVSMKDILPKALELFSEENAPLMNKMFKDLKEDSKMASFVAAYDM